MTYGASAWAALSFASVPATPATGRRIKHFRKSYLMRDGEVLVFQSEEEMRQFMADEGAKPKKPSVTERLMGKL